jgi:hypothetical protein
MLLPTFSLSLDEASTFPVDRSRFGDFARSTDVSFDQALPENARYLCMVYEEILRRLFKECRVFNNHILVSNNIIHLNSIDVFSSRLILEFLKNPVNSRYLHLYRVLRRRYCVRPEVMVLIICRNLGIHAYRVATDSECEEYCQWLSDCREQLGMPGSTDKHLSWLSTKAQLVILALKRPIVFLSQTSPFTSTTMLTLLKDKSLASALLRTLGFSVPTQIILHSESDLALARNMKEVILKPSVGSNRRGVIGPIHAADSNRMRDCYHRCVSQTADSSPSIIAEEYIRGVAYRINVNHGKVTFVARSVRNEVTGDGTSSIRTLLEAHRKDRGLLSWFPDALIENTIVGAGLHLDDVLKNGERLLLSHDGNEEGSFIDAGDEFPEKFKKQALDIAEHLGCPVLGIDALTDEHDQLWIVDVNAEAPAVALFPDPRRAYETMEHMVRQTLSRMSEISVGAATVEAIPS